MFFKRETSYYIVHWSWVPFFCKKVYLCWLCYSPMFCMHAIYSTLTFIKILQALSSAFELKIHENGEAKHVKKRDLNPGWKAKQSCRIPQVLHRELFKSPFSVSLETLTAAADKTTTTCYYLHIDEILRAKIALKPLALLKVTLFYHETFCLFHSLLLLSQVLKYLLLFLNDFWMGCYADCMIR